MALSLRTIGHSKQSEVIGQTLGVRPPPAWRSSEPQRAGKLAGRNVTFWKTSSLRPNRGRVNTRSPAENRSRQRSAPPAAVPARKGAREARGAEGAGRRARLSRVHPRPRSEGLLSPARSRSCLGAIPTSKQVGAEGKQLKFIRGGPV